MSPDALQRAERSDVRRNRAALLRAGLQLLNDDPDVALYEVARLSGVGQATLYRHFPDRASLALAVADEIFDEVEAELATLDHDSPQALYQIIERLALAMIETGSYYTLLHHSHDDHADIDRLRTRVRGLVVTPLRAAKRARVVQREIRVDDILLVIRMMTSTVRATVEEPVSKTRRLAARRALKLVWGGLAEPTADNATLDKQVG